MSVLVDRFVTNVLVLPRVESRQLLEELKQLDSEVSAAVESRLAELRSVIQGCPRQTAILAQSPVLTLDHQVQPGLYCLSQVRSDLYLSPSLLLSCGAWFLRRRSLVTVASNRAMSRAIPVGRGLFANLIEMLATLISRCRRAFVFSSTDQKNEQVDRGPANQPSILSAFDRTFDPTICSAHWSHSTTFRAIESSGRLNRGRLKSLAFYTTDRQCVPFLE